MDEGSGQQRKRDRDGWSDVPGRDRDGEKTGRRRESRADLGGGGGVASMTSEEDEDEGRLFFKQMSCSNNNRSQLRTQFSLSQQLLHPLRAAVLF